MNVVGCFQRGHDLAAGVEMFLASGDQVIMQAATRRVVALVLSSGSRDEKQIDKNDKNPTHCAAPLDWIAALSTRRQPLPNEFSSVAFRGAKGRPFAERKATLEGRASFQACY